VLTSNDSSSSNLDLNLNLNLKLKLNLNLKLTSNDSRSLRLGTTNLVTPNRCSAAARTVGWADSAERTASARTGEDVAKSSSRALEMG
jgi:hypothetical protein